MKKIQLAIMMIALFVPGVVYAVDCDVYHEAIMSCAKNGCDTTIDDFSMCLVEEQGISEMAEDGTNEVEELVACFHSQYQCE